MSGVDAGIGPIVVHPAVAALNDACRAAGVGRFVHGSTIGVYGDREGILDETTPPAEEAKWFGWVVGGTALVLGIVAIVLILSSVL